MLGLSRKQEIQELVSKEGSVIVAELSARYNISEETIRKDLKVLEEEGSLQRIYGGAVRINSNREVETSVRQKLYVKDKQLMAAVCEPLVNTHDSVFFDGSTTAYAIAQAVSGKSLTVITNSILVAGLFSESPKAKLVLLGGVYDPSRKTFLGRTTELCMQNYYFDKAFISCQYLHLQHGITDSNESNAMIRRLAVEHANCAYLVVDHTKFNKTSFSYIAGLENIHALVTNKPLSENWAATLKQKKVKTFIAEEFVPGEPGEDMETVGE